MTPSFFKMRGLFDFSPHPYDVGNPVLQTWYYIDNHVCNKIYHLPESEYRPFYDYHLQYYLAKNPEAELDFFQNLWEIVSDRRDYYKRQEYFSVKQKQARQNLVKIKQFQSFLISMDQWQTSLPLDFLLSQKNEEIYVRDQQIVQLKQQVKEMKKYEPTEKITIASDHLPTFVHLLHQMQELQLPSNSKLLRYQSKSSWYKFLSRYFVTDKQDINLETARNYFPSDNPEGTSKGTEIKPDKKLFKIVPSKRR